MCILCSLPDGRTVLFRYLLLWGNTAAPSGLLARLCHAFLVLVYMWERHYMHVQCVHVCVNIVWVFYLTVFFVYVYFASLCMPLFVFLMLSFGEINK